MKCSLRGLAFNAANCSSQGFSITGNGFSLGSSAPNRDIADVMLTNAYKFFEGLGLEVKVQVHDWDSHRHPTIEQAIETARGKK